MDKEKLILEEIRYMADGHTIKEASEKFERSISTIKKDIAKFRNKSLGLYNETLDEKLKLAQAKNLLEGRLEGASKGKRGKSYEDFTARMYAEAYMASGMSLEELSILSKIPRSTLHDMIRGIDDEEIQKRLNEYIYNEKKKKYWNEDVCKR